MGHQGSMEENYWYCEEEMYVKDAEGVLDFCKWIDRTIGGCSRYNIDMLFKAYDNPFDAKAAEAAHELKLRIIELTL